MVATFHAKLNIKQLAQRAGVSTSTISRVLNKSGYVKDEVRKRIEQVIAETGYTPSGVAKSLKSSRTDMIGVILPRINSFATSGITAGISARLATDGYMTILGNATNDPKNELHYLDIFKSQRVSGILILATVTTPDHMERMRTLGVPIVVIGQDVSPLGFASVIQDERRATRQLTDYLIRSGHRRIGMIGVAEWDRQIGCERKSGYLDALAAAGLHHREEHIVLGGFDLHDGAHGADRLVAYLDDTSPTAILAVTDRLAIGAINRLAERLINVPADISIVGVGDIDVASVYRPKLTTIHFDYVATGAAAADMLIKQLRGDPLESIRTVMPFDLRIRDSVRILE